MHAKLCKPVSLALVLFIVDLVLYSMLDIAVRGFGLNHKKWLSEGRLFDTEERAGGFSFGRELIEPLGYDLPKKQGSAEKRLLRPWGFKTRLCAFGAHLTTLFCMDKFPLHPVFWTGAFGPHP